MRRRGWLEVACWSGIRAAVAIALVALLFESAPAPKHPTCLVFQCFAPTAPYTGGDAPDDTRLEHSGPRER